MHNYFVSFVYYTETAKDFGNSVLHLEGPIGSEEDLRFTEDELKQEIEKSFPVKVTNVKILCLKRMDELS